LTRNEAIANAAATVEQRLARIEHSIIRLTGTIEKLAGAIAPSALRHKSVDGTDGETFSSQVTGDYASIGIPQADAPTLDSRPTLGLGTGGDAPHPLEGTPLATSVSREASELSAIFSALGFPDRDGDCETLEDLRMAAERFYVPEQADADRYIEGKHVLSHFSNPGLHLPASSQHSRKMPSTC